MESSSGITGKAYNIVEWIEDNKSKFMPPVCLRLMHDRGQMKCFFVGGPNERRDYHMECGEELFYMWRGDMVLKVVERGVHRDVIIKEGQMFLLPACIPHSPQRKADTVGLVLERERAEHEKDGLRYFIEEGGKVTTDVLYEEWFHCDDLGSLGPIIKRFFASEQSKTGKPIPGTIPDVKPLELDVETTLTDPIDFHHWVDAHREKINAAGYIRVYPEFHQFQLSSCVSQHLLKLKFVDGPDHPGMYNGTRVFVLGQGERDNYCEHAEAWLWQLEGESQVTYGDVKGKLKKDDSFLVPAGEKFTVKQELGSLVFVAYQDPSKCPTWAQ